MNVLNIEHVSKLYGEKKIFDDVSYGIHEGDKIGIIGINGTGKTTLLKIIAGLEEPDEGQVIRQNGLRVTYLPQNPEFPDGATVLSYVADGKLSQDWATESEAKTVLNNLGITEHDALIEHLSGGQKKRVALARTLVNPADVLILDEPLSGVDIAGEHQLLDMLDEVRTHFDLSILLSTHDFATLEQFADQVLLLKHRVLKTGTPSEVLSSPEFQEVFHLRIGKGGVEA